MRIDHFEVVTKFRLEEGIVLTVGPRVKGLENTLGAKVQVLNVPQKARPDIPRIILGMQNAQVQICLDRYTIVIKPPEHIKSNINSSLDFMSNLFEKILPGLMFESFVYESTGIISIFEFPCALEVKGSKEFLRPIFDRLINIKRDERSPLASFQLQFGLQEGDFFKNFTISGYDSYNIPLPIKTGQQDFQRIPLSKQFIVESGINLVWDINNMPSKSKLGALPDFRKIITVIRTSYSELLTSLHLEGLLSW